jgi:hypothetical protein
MSDDKTRKSQEDNKQIDINDAKEIAHWCESFSCSEGDLRVAVMAVGKSVSALKEYFSE